MAEPSAEHSQAIGREFQNETCEGPSKPDRQEWTRYDRYYSTKDSRYHYRPTAKEHDKAKKFSKYVLVVIKKVNYKGLIDGVEVQIKGKLLRDVLVNFFKGVEEARLSESPPVIPPQLLYHAQEELEKVLKKAKSERDAENDLDKTEQKELVFELSTCLKFIQEEYGTAIESLRTMLRKEEITFTTIWQILPPNELVFWKDKLGEPGVYCYESHRVRQRSDGSLYMQMNIKAIDDDGARFGVRRSRSIEVNEFEEAKKIARLSVFPLRFHPERSGIEGVLKARGRKWLELRGQHFKEYTGLALMEKRRMHRGEDVITYEKFNSHGRVMIDPRAYNKHEANNTFVPEIVDLLNPDDLTEQETLLLPSKVYGFCFGAKQWGDYRKVVKSHLIGQNGFDDFVSGKGLGLIGLLSGPPGVGKTLTAEAVAEILQRPLYAVTSGELGDQPHQVDGSLRKALELAHDWDAVMLLDEADVFLAKRTESDLVRNGIVSIFLRQLEYYHGILFLTTNRMDVIDPAFKSRIHFTHFYPQLTPEVRKSIWRSFLKRAVGVPHIKVSIDEEGVALLAAQQINGRQIKNTMKIAQSVAVQDRAPLTAKSIMDITDLLQDVSLKDNSNELSLI